MDREQAKDYVKQGLEQYLHSKGIDTRKKFRCLNPAHNDTHASMSIDRSSKSGLHCKCFSCNAYYDTFDLIAIDYGITDETEVFNKAYEIFRLQIDDSSRKSTTADHRGQVVPETNQKRTDIQSDKHNTAYTTQNTQSDIHNTECTTQNTQSDKHNTECTKQNTQSDIHNIAYTIQHTQYAIEELEEAPVIDFTAILEAAHRELLGSDKAQDYLKSRGLSLNIIKKYKLGYAAGGYNSLLKDMPQLQSKSRKADLYKYIFPYTDAEGRLTYFLSEITDRQQVDDYNGKYRKISKGDTRLAAQIFNERYLQQGAEAPEVVFICEGIYDALSVEEVGGKAIAFCGTAHKRFLQLCKKYKPQTTFIISLDNDGAGQQAIEKVKEGLDYLKLPYIIRTAATGKDFNDDLREDKGSFTDYIKQVIADATEEQRELEKQEREAYMQTSTAYYLQSFIDEIEKSKTASYYSTGFSSVDDLIDGGLYSGLYCIGAISSLGKTTFCLQVIDNIAAAGHDAIIFSLEMARSELIAKSVSRHTLLEDLKQNKSTNHAKTTRGITTGTRYTGYNREDRRIIEDAIVAYSQYADNIYIHEGVGDIGVDAIKETVERHIKITGNKPIVLIDYLQILAPYSERATDKQKTDKAVLELKRLSRDYSIPVICISSFNRDSYTDPVNMASFKESGAVEYSSDVLIALQYEGMDWQEGENEKERNKRVRELLNNAIFKGKQGKAQSIQVKVLKNRNGSKGETAIDFYPMFNYFTDKGKVSTALAPAADEWQTISGTDLTDTPFA